MSISQQKTAKVIKIRGKFGIPKEGFNSEQEALDWYKGHFKVAKGIDFTGSFGFRYTFPLRNMLEFDYRVTPEGFYIAFPYPLDNDVPFDREVWALAKELKLPEWGAHGLRLVLFIGGLFDDEVPYITSWLMAPAGLFHILF